MADTNTTRGHPRAQGQQPTMNLTLTWPIQDHQAPLPDLIERAEQQSFAVLEANEPAGWRMRSPWVREVIHDHIPAIALSCRVSGPDGAQWTWPPTVREAA